MRGSRYSPTNNMKIYGRRGRRSLLTALGVVAALTLAAIVFAPNPVELVSEEEPPAERTAEDEEKNSSSETDEREPEQEASGENEASERDEQANAERGDAERGDTERGDAGNGEGGQSSAGRSGEEESPGEEEASPPSSDRMSLTVPRLDIYGDTVRNSADPAALHQGAQKLPSTGFPWQDGANTYIAGHRIGFPGTQSHNQFYDLPAMQQGDEVSLTDADGAEYEYEVTEIFAVSPSENWVTEPVAGKDMVTLQTCTHTPEDWHSITPQLFEAGPETGRLVVRAERV